MYTVRKTFSFEAAHSLDHLPPEHKCRRKHGHSYLVELVLSTNDLDERGFAGVDYADLDAFQAFLDDELDHRDLNEVLGSAAHTTAENLARYLFGWAKARWPQLDTVRVSETRKTWVEYTPGRREGPATP